MCPSLTETVTALFIHEKPTKGFRALGTGRFMSAFVAVFFNMGLSQKTRPVQLFGYILPLFLKPFVCTVVTTDVYDKDGRFVESKFEEIFNKHARTHKDALTAKEIKQMLKTNREPYDFIGWLSDFIEWKILHTLAQDNGLLTEDAVRGVYDGSLFQQLEKKRSSSSSRGKKQKLP